MAQKIKLFLNCYPEDKKFNRVHAILLTEDERVLLRYKNGEPRVTGGRLEPNEDIIAALKREVKEEINCEVDQCDYLGYIEAKDENGLENWARVVARVAKILPAQADPDRAGNWIYGRTLAPRELAEAELAKVKILGDNNIKVLDAAYRMAQMKNYFTKPICSEYTVINAESRDEEI